MTEVTINNTHYQIKSEPDTPLLWVLRDELGLMGSKYGCGIASCGSCAVLVNGDPVLACITPISAIEGKTVITIEGLSSSRYHPVQQAWIELQVPQCGYCQSGQIINAVALLSRIPDPTDEDIDQAMGGILCRCGTYQRIRQAIKRAAELSSSGI